MQPLKFYTANAFAPTPHGGNQAAVVLFPAGDARAADDAYLTSLAADFNLAETAFVTPLDGGDIPRYSLRWFTPTTEVPLCGHATLAAATALFHVHPDAEALEFETRWRGTLTARLVRRGPKAALTIAISLPLPEELRPATEAETEAARAALAAASGHKGEVVRAARFEFGTVIELPASADIGALEVDTAPLLPGYPELFIVTQVAGAGEGGSAVINSRVFAPGLGIPEDPVTGAAHAALAAYYLADGAGRASVGAVAPGAKVLDARQLSRRGGAMLVELEGGRATLTGRGWRTARGELEVLQ